MFVDASHFFMGCDYLGYIYGKARKFVRTYSGRSRYNVLGALDCVSKRLTTITNDAYITATEVCEQSITTTSRNSKTKLIQLLNALELATKTLLTVSLEIKFSFLTPKFLTIMLHFPLLLLPLSKQLLQSVKRPLNAWHMFTDVSITRTVKDKAYI